MLEEQFKQLSCDALYELYNEHVNLLADYVIKMNNIDSRRIKIMNIIKQKSREEFNNSETGNMDYINMPEEQFEQLTYDEIYESYNQHINLLGDYVMEMNNIDSRRKKILIIYRQRSQEDIDDSNSYNNNIDDSNSEIKYDNINMSEEQFDQLTYDGLMDSYTEHVNLLGDYVMKLNNFDSRRNKIQNLLKQRTEEGLNDQVINSEIEYDYINMSEEEFEQLTYNGLYESYTEHVNLLADYVMKMKNIDSRRIKIIKILKQRAGEASDSDSDSDSDSEYGDIEYGDITVTENINTENINTENINTENINTNDSDNNSDNNSEFSDSGDDDENNYEDIDSNYHFESLKDISDKYPIIFNDHELSYTDLILKMYNNNNINTKNYDLEDVIILNLIGQYYHYIYINYNKMIKYYTIAIEKNYMTSMYNLGFYYQNIDYELMKMYYLMAIDKNCSNSMNDLKQYYFTEEINGKLKFYNLLCNLQIDSDIVIKTINELLDESEIVEYKNKINMNKNNIKDCIICYETLLHIPFNCSHEICINCYCLVDRCYYKCC